MNAGAVRNSSNYYLKSYGLEEKSFAADEETLEATEYGFEAEGAEDLGGLSYYSEAYGEATETQDAVPQLFASVVLEELRGQEAGLQAQLEEQPENRMAQESLRAVQFLMKRLIPYGKDAEVPSYLRDEYLQLQLQLRVSHHVSGPLERIERLSPGIEAALKGQDLPPELRRELEAILPKLRKAKAALELAQDPEAAAQAEAAVEEDLSRAEEIFGDYQEAHEAWKAEIAQAMEDFSTKLRLSPARGYDRIKIAKQLEILKAQFEAGELPLQEVADQLQGLDLQLLMGERGR
ncbi:hypothetical protein FBR05_13485 [Deltaproteobacteria bacterium PRO3]|nr:hypothetical protein [Deltaproteobacteria bacterium PRO3]